MKRSSLPPIGLSLLVATVYFAGAELGLSLATLHQNVTPVWPPTGIAIAALLIFGGRVWPGVHRRSRCKLTHQHFRCFRSQHRNGFGALIVSPFLLSWRSSRKIDRREIPELASLFVLLLIVVLIVFAGWSPRPVKTYPLAYLCLPCLLWAALKFDQRIVTSAIVLMAALAVWGAKHGYGPFVQLNANALVVDVVCGHQFIDDVACRCGYD